MDRVHPVATDASPIPAIQEPVGPDRDDAAQSSPAHGLVRSLAMVALAMLAILALLPAIVAAQAATAF
jgi:hypothetical protein